MRGRRGRSWRKLSEAPRINGRLAVGCTAAGDRAEKAPRPSGAKVSQRGVARECKERQPTPIQYHSQLPSARETRAGLVGRQKQMFGGH